MCISRCSLFYFSRYVKNVQSVAEWYQMTAQNLFSSWMDARTRKPLTQTAGQLERLRRKWGVSVSTAWFIGGSDCDRASFFCVVSFVKILQMDWHADQSATVHHEANRESRRVHSGLSQVQVSVDHFQMVCPSDISVSLEQRWHIVDIIANGDGLSDWPA